MTFKEYFKEELKVCKNFGSQVDWLAEKLGCKTCSLRHKCGEVTYEMIMELKAEAARVKQAKMMLEAHGYTITKKEVR